MLVLDQGTDAERTLRVVLESEEYGREYFDSAETLDELLELHRRVLCDVLRHNDGVERVVGIVVVPKDCYGDPTGHSSGFLKETTIEPHHT